MVFSKKRNFQMVIPYAHPHKRQTDNFSNSQLFFMTPLLLDADYWAETQRCCTSTTSQTVECVTRLCSRGCHTERRARLHRRITSSGTHDDDSIRFSGLELIVVIILNSVHQTAHLLVNFSPGEACCFVTAIRGA